MFKKALAFMEAQFKCQIALMDSIQMIWLEVDRNILENQTSF